MNRHDSSRQPILQTMLVVGLSFIMIAASGAEQTGYGDVISKALANNCNGAVVELNAGLAANQPDLIFLAASMFEEGNCLDQDWEKATQLYKRAYELGNQRALPRLVALFALRNRDPAAALWWASRRPLGLPPVCLPSEDGLRDPSLLVAELNAWAPDRLKACVYTAGVFNSIFAQVGFSIPGRPMSKKLMVEVTFVPGTASIEWRTSDDGVAYSGVAGADRVPGKSRSQGHPLTYLTRLGDEVLENYGPILNIDPTWKVKTTIGLDLE